MKRITALLISIIFVISLVPSFASAAATANYYEWTFEDAALNDEEGKIYTANTQNNKIRWNESSTYTNYTATDVEVGVVTSDYPDILGKALLACGGYFKLDKPIYLDGDKPWRFELSGRLPTGVNSNPINPQTMIFSPTENANTNEGITLSININLMNYLGNNITSESNSPTWKSGTPRLGQKNVETLTVWNEYNETDGHWYIHWTVTAYNSPDAGWSGPEYVTTTPTDELNLGISYFGNEIHPFSFAVGGSELAHFKHYLSDIKIWEDYEAYIANFNKTKIESIPEGMIETLPANVDDYLYTDIATQPAGCKATLAWQKEDGSNLLFAVAGKNIAVITLVPEDTYEFIADIKASGYDSCVLNEDGSVTLTKVFVIEAPETTVPDTTAEETAAPTPDTSSAPETTAGEEKSGCGATIGGAGIILAMLGAAFVFKKKN